jgi:hypothetical protein
MTAITETTLETTATSTEAPATGTSFATPILWSAVGEHVLAWADNIARFAIGVLLAWGMLALAQWPDLSFLAAFSALTGLLYLGNMADVERYRDGILFVVPTLFVWVVLGLGAANASLVGLTLFTHVFLSFVGAFARNTGTLRLLRLWSLLLGVQLVLLVYLVNTFLLK